MVATFVITIIMMVIFADDRKKNSKKNNVFRARDRHPNGPRSEGARGEA